MEEKRRHPQHKSTPNIWKLPEHVFDHLATTHTYHFQKSSNSCDRENSDGATAATRHTTPGAGRPPSILPPLNSTPPRSHGQGCRTEPIHRLSVERAMETPTLLPLDSCSTNKGEASAGAGSSPKSPLLQFYHRQKLGAPGEAPVTTSGT